MKYLSFLFLLFFINLGYSQVNGCDGSRYILDVFDEVIISSTVQYGENINSLGVNQELFMEIYEPAGDEVDARPLVVLAHGGSFIFGTRFEMIDFCEQLAKKGYVAATIDYRLYSLLNGAPNEENMTDAVAKAVSDMKAAVGFFVKDASEENVYKIDTNNIIVGGYSAGAFTALHTAYLNEGDPITAAVQEAIDNNGGWSGNSGNDGYSASYKSVVNLSGALLDAQYLSEGEAAIASYHGTDDQTVPYGEGQAIGIIEVDGSSLVHERADEVGVQNYLYTVEGGGHTDIYADPAYAADLTNFTLNLLIFNEALICTTVGVDDFDNEILFSVFPNPIIDRIDLEFTEVVGRKIFLVDNFGHTLFSAKSNSLNFSIKRNQNWIKGIYYVVIQNENNSGLTTKKIIFD